MARRRIGYELYSNLSGGTLTFALKAPVAIGTSTTVWLDSDRSALTGYKVFGTYGGYDYNINFAADGKPYLYTDADGQTLASPTPLTYAFNADKTAVEFSPAAGPDQQRRHVGQRPGRRQQLHLPAR